MAPNARGWACGPRECARACVCARLRTHLGGPAQTFAAFERSLVGGATSSIRGETGLGERQQALVSMLVFLDALEQHIYSASSGCFRSAVAMDDSGMLAVNSSSASAFRLPPPSQSAELFFRTNQKVCEEWLARIRPRALSASVVCGATMDTVRHGLLRANDVSRQLLRLPASAAPTDARRVLRDFDACMAPLLSALAKLRESDTILGLITWYTSVLGRSQHASHLSARTTTGSKPCCSCLTAHKARSSSVSRCFRVSRYRRRVTWPREASGGGQRDLIGMPLVGYARVAHRANHDVPFCTWCVGGARIVGCEACAFAQNVRACCGRKARG